MKTEDLPLIDPSDADLVARLKVLRDAGFSVSTMSMSPETWGKLSASALALEAHRGGPLFDKVPVKFHEGQIGVAIAYSRP
jgi:hypothetical protein